MENEDVIRRQMEETRTSLAEKVETLEQTLVGTVQETAASVTDTVANVKETVQESVDNVKETVQEGVDTVKHWLDLPAQVDEHPWTMLAGSMAIGFALGNLLGGKQSAATEQSSSAASWRAPQQQHNGGKNRPVQQAVQQVAEKATSWLSQFEPELNKLKGLALGAVLGTLREMIRHDLPSELGDRFKGIVDDITRKVGGEPISSSDWTEPPAAEQHGHAAEQTQSGEQEDKPESVQTGTGKKKQSGKHQERFKMQ